MIFTWLLIKIVLGYRKTDYQRLSSLSNIPTTYKWKVGSWFSERHISLTYLGLFWLSELHYTISLENSAIDFFEILMLMILSSSQKASMAEIVIFTFFAVMSDIFYRLNHAHVTSIVGKNIILLLFFLFFRTSNELSASLLSIAEGEGSGLCNILFLF